MTHIAIIPCEYPQFKQIHNTSFLKKSDFRREYSKYKIKLITMDDFIEKINNDTLHFDNSYVAVVTIKDPTI